MRRLLNFLALCCFLTAGVMTYAHVYDVEPINLAREYYLEKEVFDRSNDDWSREFPDLADWLNENATREERLRDWLASVRDDIGIQFAEIWEPGAQERFERDAERSPSPEAYAFERGHD